VGVVARQTLKKSIVMVIGVVVATLSTLFIYPLDLSLYGSIQFIISASTLIIPLATLGVQSLAVRFYPLFKDGHIQNHGFLGFLFLCMAVAMVLFFAISFIAKPHMFNFFSLVGWSPSIFEANVIPIISLTLSRAYYFLTQYYLTNYQRVVVPGLLNEIVVKLAVPIIILLSIHTLISDDHLKMYYVVINYLALLFLFYYTFKLGAMHLRIDWSFITKGKVKEFSEYAIFGILGSLSSVIAFRIDTVMVAGFTDFEKTGIYAIALYVAGIIIIPSNSIIPLVGAQISRLHSDNNIIKIEELYKKSSLTLIIIGLCLFLIIWTNLSDIFMLTPRSEDLLSGRMVVFYIGLAKLIDMSFSVNGAIISFGKYYRWNFLFIILMAVLTILTNLYFIPRIGFEGAAIATLISLGLFNLVKFAFILIIYGIHPFRYRTLWVVLIAAICFFIIDFIPNLNHPIFNIILKSGVVLLVYALPIYYFKISEDINGQVDKLLNRAKSFF